MIDSLSWKWSMVEESFSLHKYSQSLLSIPNVQAWPETFDEL